MCEPLCLEWVVQHEGSLPCQWFAFLYPEDWIANETLVALFARIIHANITADFGSPLNNTQESEERQKPQPPLLKKVLQCTSNLYCKTPPTRIGVLLVKPKFWDCQSSQFWCTSRVGARLGGSLAPKRVSNRWFSKWQVLGTFKLATLLHQQFWVFPTHAPPLKIRQIRRLVSFVLGNIEIGPRKDPHNIW